MDKDTSKQSTPSVGTYTCVWCGHSGLAYTGTSWCSNCGQSDTLVISSVRTN